MPATFDVDKAAALYGRRIPTKDIARSVGVSTQNVRVQLRQRGLLTRKPGNQFKHPPAPEGFKTCRVCAKVKPLDAFGKHGHNKDGLRHECKLCHVEEARWTAMKRVYGLTKTQYESMLADQKGVCYICRQPETQRNRTNLSVDHCHKKGHVRHLLCSRCNMIVGLTHEDPGLCARIQTYLLTESKRST